MIDQILVNIENDRRHDRSPVIISIFIPLHLLFAIREVFLLLFSHGSFKMTIIGPRCISIALFDRGLIAYFRFFLSNVTSH